MWSTKNGRLHKSIVVIKLSIIYTIAQVNNHPQHKVTKFTFKVLVYPQRRVPNKKKTKMHIFQSPNPTTPLEAMTTYFPISHTHFTWITRDVSGNNFFY